MEVTLQNYLFKTMKLEKGHIIEIKVPNVENPIKAVVIENYGSAAQKRIFKASN